MTSIPKEALSEYISEVRDLCQRITRNAAMLAREDGARGAVQEIYRDMHLIRGSSEMFGFRHIGELAYVMEAAIDPFRSDGVVIGDDLMIVCRDAVNMIGQMLQSVIEHGDDAHASAKSMESVLRGVASLTIREFTEMTPLTPMTSVSPLASKPAADPGPQAYSPSARTVMALIIREGQDFMAIDQRNIVEILSFQLNNTGHCRTATIQGRTVLLWQEKVLPVVNLRGILSSNHEGPAASGIEADANVVVVNDGFHYALVVGELLDMVEVRLQALPKVFSQLVAYSGVAVSNDHLPRLMLSVSGVAKIANLKPIDMDSYSQFGISKDTRKNQREHYLVVDLGVSGSYLLPLQGVEGIVVIPSGSIQFSGRLPLTRYQGSLLPLISVGAELGLPGSAALSQVDETPVTVAVVRSGSRLFGLVFSSAAEVITLSEAVDGNLSDSDGIAGTLLSDGNVATVINPHGIIQRYLSRLSARDGGENPVGSGAKSTGIVRAG